MVATKSVLWKKTLSVPLQRLDALLAVDDARLARERAVQVRLQKTPLSFLNFSCVLCPEPALPWQNDRFQHQNGISKQAFSAP